MNFVTTLVTDSTINDISSELEYGVKSGASSTTYQSFPASSPSNSSITFSVQVPSKNVIVSRDILLTTGLSFTINIAFPCRIFCPHSCALLMSVI